VSADAYVLNGAIAHAAVNKSIVIENNLIANDPGLAILVSSASGVTIDSNKIVNSNLLPYPKEGFPPFAGSLTVTWASSILIRGNVETATQKTYASGIYVDGQTTSDVTLTPDAMVLILPRHRAVNH